MATSEENSLRTRELAEHCKVISALDCRLIEAWVKLDLLTQHLAELRQLTASWGDDSQGENWLKEANDNRTRM